MEATTRLAEELTLSESRAIEHQRVMEAACLLKAAHEAEHERLAHEAAGRAKLLRYEEVLQATRRDNASLPAALEDAR
jgi:hypothetical protein